MAAELDAQAAGARRLKNKVCVVTGAGQGIGRATAKRLGQEGGTIVVADRVDAGATQTVNELRDQGVEVTKALVDLSTFAGAQDLMTQAKNAHARIDVLVNVGGTIWIKPYHLYTEEEVKLELERSLFPTLWCCLAVLPIMMAQRSGSIVNLGSQSIRGLHRLPYAASKERRRQSSAQADLAAGRPPHRCARRWASLPSCSGLSRYFWAFGAPFE